MDDHQFDHTQEDFDWEMYWRNLCLVLNKKYYTYKTPSLFGTEIFKEVETTCIHCFVCRLRAIFYWQGLPND